jgi:anti-anti-sigma regulatory factor
LRARVPFLCVFTSQSLRAIVRPGAITIREHRLDDVVQQVEVRGTINAETTPELARRIDGALAAGVRWLIADLSGATEVSDDALAALVGAARELRARRGEMIVAGSPADVAARLGAWEVAHRPALAANVDQAVMILKMLRPKTAVQRPSQRAKQRITSLTLPRVEPPGNPA